MKCDYIHKNITNIIVILNLIKPDDITAENVGIKPFIESIAEVFGLHELRNNGMIVNRFMLSIMGNPYTESEELVKKIPDNFRQKFRDYISDDNKLTVDIFNKYVDKQGMLESFRTWFTKLLPQEPNTKGGKRKSNRTVSRKPKKHRRTHKQKRKYNK